VVCGALEVLCEAENDLGWDQEPWRSVGDHGGQGLKFIRVRKCAVEVESWVASELGA